MRRTELISKKVSWAIASLRDSHALYLAIWRVSASNSLFFYFWARIYLMLSSSSLFFGLLAALSIIRSAFFSELKIFLRFALRVPTFPSFPIDSLRYLAISETLGLRLAWSKFSSSFQLMKYGVDESIWERLRQSLK